MPADLYSWENQQNVITSTPSDFSQFDYALNVVSKDGWCNVGSVIHRTGTILSSVMEKIIGWGVFIYSLKSLYSLYLIIWDTLLFGML